MSRLVASGLVAAGLASLGLSPSLAATGVEAPTEAQPLVEAAAEPVRLIGSTADVELRFTQEGGPESGHVRVELTPETRALTILEARSAAQQGFLAALKQPGLGDNISRITVVVRLVPASYADPAGTEQSFLFLHKGGQEWSVLSGD